MHFAIWNSFVIWSDEEFFELDDALDEWELLSQAPKKGSNFKHSSIQCSDIHCISKPFRLKQNYIYYKLELLLSFSSLKYNRSWIYGEFSQHDPV